MFLWLYFASVIMCIEDSLEFIVFIFFLMIRRLPRTTQSRSSAASDVYKRQFMYSPVLNKQGSRVWNLLKNCLQKKKCWLSPAAASDPAVKALSAVLMLTAKIICGKH